MYLFLIESIVIINISMLYFFCYNIRVFYIYIYYCLLLFIIIFFMNYNTYFIIYNGK